MFDRLCPVLSSQIIDMEVDSLTPGKRGLGHILMLTDFEPEALRLAEKAICEHACAHTLAKVYFGLICT